MKLLSEKLTQLLDSIDKKDTIKVDSSSLDFIQQSNTRLDRLHGSLERRTGYKLPEPYKEVLAFPEISCSWNFLDNENIFGGFCIANITNVLGLHEYQVNFHYEDAASKVKKIAKESRYFDVIPGLEYKVATILYPKKDVDFPEIWFLEEENLVKLNLNIDEYFEFLILTKGVHYWQYLFCDKKDYEKLSKGKKKYLQEMVTFLVGTFTDENFTTLQKRLEILEK